MTEVDPAGSRANRSAARRRHQDQWLVWVVAALAAAGAVQAGAEPTALPAVDVVLSVGSAALLVYLTARARRWSWLITAALATLGADTTVALVCGGLALLIALASTATDRRSRVLGALVAGLALQALFRLPDWEPFGTSALVGLVAVLPVCFSGLGNCRHHLRRRLAIGTLVLVLVAGGLAVLATVVALSQRTSVERAIDHAREGIEAAESGDTFQAVLLLAEAEASFAEAHDVLGAPWMVPTLGVPVIGQNADALAVAANEGAQLSAIAQNVLAQADVDRLRFEDGVLDLDLVQSFEPPLRTAADALDASLVELADADTSWLLPPVDDRYDEFTGELDDAAGDAAVAADVVEITPALFGAEGPRRYVILFTTPAEMRGLGGFVGQYGELTSIDGDVELTRSGPIAELRRSLNAPPYAITGPADYLDRWGRYQPGTFIQDTTFSPDFPSVAQIWEELYPQMPGGGEIDGVIVVDPYALAAFMEFTGSIRIEGLDEPLTSRNAARVLLRDQYTLFGNNEAEDLLEDASRETFEQLTTGDLPGPREVIDVLGPMVAQGRLLVHSIHPREQDQFVDLALDGAFPRANGDFLSVTTQNSGNNKIDIFLHRDLRYAVEYDPDSGQVRGEVTVTLRNDAPASGLPPAVIGNRDEGRIPVGANLLYLSVYTPWEITDATLDGQAISVEQAEELGRPVYGTFVQIPPGGSRTVVMSLEGAVEPSYDYSLTFAPQPLVNPDRLNLALRGAEGWEACDASGLDVTEGRARRTIEPMEDFTVVTGYCEQ